MNIKRLFIPPISSVGKRIAKKRFTEPPIYIGGCGRSGTTLLLAILSAHKDIFAIPRELNIYKNARFEKNNLSIPYFYRLYRSFIFNKIKKSANRYCEKSPVNILNYDLINANHKGVFRFIHIVRDGRDVILSNHPKKKNEYWVEPERWINDVSSGLKLLNKANVLMIKYEDLVLNYEKTIENVCQFLQIDLSNEILDWHNHATVRKNNALFRNVEKLKTSSVGKYKNSSYAKRIKQLTDIPEGNELLQELNYL